MQGDPLQPMGTPPSHVRALFRNAQIGFVLANLDRGPTGQFVTVFDVHGGFNPQVVQDPVTVEVSMPARIVYGPVDAVKQLAPFTDVTTEERYLFVVDQRRLGRVAGRGGDARAAASDPPARVHVHGRLGHRTAANLRGLQHQRWRLPDPVAPPAASSGT